jgi:hypothetical protein
MSLKYLFHVMYSVHHTHPCHFPFFIKSQDLYRPRGR